MTGMGGCAGLLLVVLGGASTAAAARADQIPGALRGHSIVLGWTSTSTERPVDTGVERTYDKSFAFKVYISSPGRIFSSYDFASRNSTNLPSKNEISGSGPSLHNWRFQDGTLVADRAFEKGARRLVVTFSGGYTNCAINIIYGKEGGAPIRMKADTSGIELELIDDTIDSTSCELRQGNIFGEPH